MDEDTIEALYEDGTVAKEIEHLLIMRLHRLNTIEEVESVKARISLMMCEMYYVGKEREEKRDK